MKVNVTTQTVKLEAHEKKAIAKAAAILKALAPHVEFAAIARSYLQANDDEGRLCVVAQVADIGVLVSCVLTTQVAPETRKEKDDASD